MGLLENLYDYQIVATNAADVNMKGIFCYPTGTGKSFILSAIIANHINFNGIGGGIYIVNCPRIVLSYQLLREVFTFLVSEKIKCRYMLVHSGGSGDTTDLDEIRTNMSDDSFYEDYRKIPATTSYSEINKMIIDASSQKMPLIIFSTYHSAEKIQKAKGDSSINMVLNDESHYLTQHQFSGLVDVIQSKKTFHFTATMINTISENGIGMNNIEKYGNVLAYMTPLEAISIGKMLRPRLHYIKSNIKYNEEDRRKSTHKIIHTAFAQHADILGSVEPKMLVSCDGSKSIINFLESTEYKTLRNSDVNIYAIASNDKIKNFINGKHYSRTQFLKKLKSAGCDPANKMLVLHHDILTEGIDVPGLTGVMLLRGLSKSKFLQTYGRVARLDPIDRSNIDNGKLLPNDLNSFVKPYGWIIIPDIEVLDNEHISNIVEIISELRAYGFNPSEDVIATNSPNGIVIKDDIESLKCLLAGVTKDGVIIDKLMPIYEDEAVSSMFTNMDDNEWINSFD